MNKMSEKISVGRGWLALSPMVLFLLLYVAVSVAIGDFYKMPVSVALLVASIWSVAVCARPGLRERIELFSASAAHKDILYMIWIFVLAGAFAAVAESIGAVEATVNLTLGIFPAEYIVPTLFVATCFISFSIGTSVGTVVALTPLAAELAASSGGNVAFYVAVVLGGAFFGDNMSFISDTTIAATRSQHCDMRDKFRANLRIALPAAILVLACYVATGAGSPEVCNAATDGHWWLMLPYLVVIASAMSGLNVCLVLLGGIVSAVLTGLFAGSDLMELATVAGRGIDGMGDLIIITLLAAGMLGVIKELGGIDFVLERLTRRVSGARGAQGVVAALVGVVNLCTANNTVAIITVGQIARDISVRFGIEGRRSASILDSASCVVQCLIPYGAQTLLATQLAGISPVAPFPYLYYPWAVALMLVVSIVLSGRRGGSLRRR